MGGAGFERFLEEMVILKSEAGMIISFIEKREERSDEIIRWTMNVWSFGEARR